VQPGAVVPPALLPSGAAQPSPSEAAPQDEPLQEAEGRRVGQPAPQRSAAASAGAAPQRAAGALRRAVEVQRHAAEEVPRAPV